MVLNRAGNQSLDVALPGIPEQVVVETGINDGHGIARRGRAGKTLAAGPAIAESQFLVVARRAGSTVIERKQGIVKKDPA